jgi:hypothetical protein
MKNNRILQKSIKPVLLCVFALFLTTFILIWYFPGVIAKTISPAVDYTPASVPGVEMKCFKENTAVPWSYCINRVASEKDSNTLVYHFHGRRGNETWWNDSTYYSGELYRDWQKSGSFLPVVVSISFGPLWLLKEGELLDTFVDVVMPKIESSLNMTIDQRFVVGESMGGVNALQVWLKTGSLFDKAAALCPPIPTISPMASTSQMVEFINQTETSWLRGFMMLTIGRHFYKDEENWQQNNPLSLVENTELSQLGDLYLTCGKRDDWGCMSGSKKLVKSIKEKGGNVEWVPREGGHCDIDHNTLAQFLSRSVKR